MKKDSKRQRREVNLRVTRDNKAFIVEAPIAYFDRVALLGGVHLAVYTHLYVRAYGIDCSGKAEFKIPSVVSITGASFTAVSSAITDLEAHGAITLTATAPARVATFNLGSWNARKACSDEDERPDVPDATEAVCVRKPNDHANDPDLFHAGNFIGRLYVSDIGKLSRKPRLFRAFLCLKLAEAQLSSEDGFDELNEEDKSKKINKAARARFATVEPSNDIVRQVFSLLKRELATESSQTPSLNKVA